MSVETISYNEKVMAIIVRASHTAAGVEFFTPNEFSQQLAAMGHKKGKIISPHIHNSVPREVELTKEVLVIKEGKLRVDFYDDDRNYLESRILHPNDVILLAYGGHGFEVLEDLQMVEIKQGPYAGDRDKIRFDGVSQKNLILKDVHDPRK